MLARDLAPHSRLRKCSDGRYAESGNLLLGDDHIFADPRNRARRLDGGQRRAGLRGRRCRVLCGTRRAGGLVLLDQRLTRVPVLGGLHPDPAARRHGRRLSRQTDEPRGPRSQPSVGVGGHPRSDRRARFRLAAKAGAPSRLPRRGRARALSGAAPPEREAGEIGRTNNILTNPETSEIISVIRNLISITWYPARQTAGFVRRSNS